MGPKRKTLSQPIPTSQAKTPKNHRSTQPNIDETFREISVTPVDIDEHVNDFVRYIVYKAGQQLPFRKSDLQKHIKGILGRTFDKVLEKASNILEKVYGIKLILCDSGSKFYVASNNLSHVEEDLEDETLTELPEDRRKILLMLILIHIYMSSSVVTQASLYSFLRSLQVDPDRKHELFGNVKEYITITLVKQHYLNIEKDSISQDLTFSWGARAEREISKHDLLQLVCKILKDSEPKAWTSQYKDAEAQPLENHRNAQMDDELNEQTEE